MSKDLKDFFSELESDPQKLASFRTDPRGYVNATDLPEKAKRAVIRGDRKEIERLVGPGNAVDWELMPFLSS